MASYTPNLNLYKKDPIADGNDFFNIKTMMNDNWDKIDEKVKAALDDIGDLQSEQVRIATGSYVGTGTYGASNPCSLTFPFPPKILFLPGGNVSYVFHGNVIGGDGIVSPAILLPQLARTTFSDEIGFYSGPEASLLPTKRSQDGKIVSWFFEYGASGQLNQSGITYYWVAFG